MDFFELIEHINTSENAIQFLRDRGILSGPPICTHPLCVREYESRGGVGVFICLLKVKKKGSGKTPRKRIKKCVAPRKRCCPVIWMNLCGAKCTAKKPPRHSIIFWHKLHIFTLPMLNFMFLRINISCTLQ